MSGSVPMRFDLPYVSEALPFASDQTPQSRVIRGRLVLPEATAGREVRGPVPVVIVAHGYTSFMDWGFFPALSEALAAAGIASLRFNFSGSGIGEDLQTMTEPEVFRRNSYLHELDDLRVLHEHVLAGHWPELDPQRLGILGHSRGGGMSLVHASEVGDYRAVVTWAAIDRVLNFSDERLELWRRQGFLDVMHWTARRLLPLDVETLDAAEEARERLDIAGACGRLDGEVLVVVGDSDRSVPASAGPRLAAACGSRGRLLVVPDGDHTFGARHPFSRAIPPSLRLLLGKSVAHCAAALC